MKTPEQPLTEVLGFEKCGCPFTRAGRENRRVHEPESPAVEEAADRAGHLFPAGIREPAARRDLDAGDQGEPPPRREG